MSDAIVLCLVLLFWYSLFSSCRKQRLSTLRRFKSAWINLSTSSTARLLHPNKREILSWLIGQNLGGAQLGELKDVATQNRLLIRPLSILESDWVNQNVVSYLITKRFLVYHFETHLVCQSLPFPFNLFRNVVCIWYVYMNICVIPGILVHVY